MFKVTVPEHPNIRPVETRTLKDAIKEKSAFEVNYLKTHAIITDEDGYIISSREQKLYIIQNLV